MLWPQEKVVCGAVVICLFHYPLLTKNKRVIPHGIHILKEFCRGVSEARRIACINFTKNGWLKTLQGLLRVPNGRYLSNGGQHGAGSCSYIQQVQKHGLHKFHYGAVQTPWINNRSLPRCRKSLRSPGFTDSTDSPEPLLSGAGKSLLGRASMRARNRKSVLSLNARRELVSRTACPSWQSARKSLGCRI